MPLSLPKAVDVAGVLMEALSPREMPAEWGDRATWPFHGVPENIVIDVANLKVLRFRRPGILPDTVYTTTFNAQISGPFAEADLQAEWMTDLEGLDSGSSASFHQWVRAAADSSEGVSRQSLLDDPQTRAGVRRQMRAEIKARLAAA